MWGPKQKIFLSFLVFLFLFAPSSLQAADFQTSWVKTVVAKETFTGKVVEASNPDSKSTKIVDPLSVRSLLLIQQSNSEAIGKATGFVVESSGAYYLITNWHVVSGRHPHTNRIENPKGRTPDSLRIIHHAKKLGTRTQRIEPLYEKGSRRWLEHPKGRRVDVVGLPLRSIDSEVQLYPFDLSLADTDMMIEVAMRVSIIGFPLGLTGPRMFPIWKTGHIASDPALDYRGAPRFLIDATTRGGMSGSPVVVKMRSGYQTRDGEYPISSRPRTRFVGIYSGRLPGDSNVGLVWRPEVIWQILGTR